ncbi:chromosome segregation protein [Legionella pneumophila]|uniref:hypothetical protein n=1 Tax=Legionella pneumophila TaxID=446 RepID=UPI0007707087|nr:hypothetical protein [Legionella pneumophila]CZH86341.1 chromosome segregation protein [Legionella pneumophila]
MNEKIEPKNWLEDFAKDSTPDPSNFGYVPLPTNVQGEPKGSVYMAHLRQENTIGAMLNRKSTFQLNENVREDYDFTNYVNQIPKDLINYADKFFGATTEDEFKSIEAQIRQEIEDKSVIAAHPWKSLAYALDPLEPTNWIPGGVIYKEAKVGAAVARSMMGVGISAVASTGIQEAILHQNQLTRTMQESIFNTVGAGIFGGVVGGGISAIASRRLAKGLNAEEIKIAQRIHNDINDALNPNENLSAARSAIMDDSEIARMPKFIQSTMKLTPMNRLLTSPFKTSKWFGSAAFEHNYELVKNSDGITGGVSLERSIKMEMKNLNNLQVEHMNHYYAMHGVTSKYFRATQKKMRELGTISGENMNLDQFNRAVYEVALTGQEHELSHVNAAAKMWRDEFDRLQKQAIDLGLLPEDVKVPNAPNYIMVMYNKNKIIEEGGKSARGEGTFANHLFQQFQATNEIVRQFTQSPFYTEAQALIKTNQEAMRRLPPERLKAINEKLIGIDKRIKELEKLKNKRPQEQLDKIEANIKSLNQNKKELSDSITKKQSDYVDQIKREIDSHAKSAADYKTRVKKSREKLNALKNKTSLQLKKIGEIRGRIKEIKGDTPKKERLKQQLDEANALHMKLKDQEKELSLRIKQEEDHIKTNAKRISELEAIAKHPERTLPELQKKIKELEDKIKSLEESKKPTSSEIRAHEKAIKELEKEKKTIEKSREITKEEKERLTKEIEALEKSIIDNAPNAAKDWEGKLHRLIEDDGVQTEEELIWAQVEQTIDHILGDSDAKLLNPFLSKLGGATKPFKARKLIIDQLQASPWHITDIQKIAEAHNRAMVPAIQLQRFAQSHGYKDIDDFLLGIGDTLRKEFDTQSAGLTGKQAQKLREQYNSNIEDMKAAIQMLQGVYGQGFNVLNSSGAEFFNNVMNWNHTRMLGHMTISSLPDLGMLVMRNGLMATLAHGIGESFSVVKKISKNDIKALGYAIETELGTQIKTYIEHSGLSTNPSPFTKGLNSLTRAFGNLSLMNPWTDMIQNMAGHIAINRILTTIHKVVNGESVAKKETTLLARLGISNEYFSEIAKFTKDNVYKGTRYADWTNWDIKTPSELNALKAFQAAVGKSIDEISLSPNLGDKPLLLQQRGAFGHMTNLMFQFKSFLFAATNRIFYSGIQNRNDINLYLGAVSMMGLGMLGYVVSSHLRGNKEIDLSTKNLLREGVDRSGILAIFGEGINIGQKLFQLGEVSRYKSRDAFGSVLGPTGGSVSQLVSLFNKLNPLSTAKGEWTTKDAEAVMRLMPLQNLFYLQRINRQLAHNIAVGLGATSVAE